MKYGIKLSLRHMWTLKLLKPSLNVFGVEHEMFSFVNIIPKKIFLSLIK